MLTVQEQNRDLRANLRTFHPAVLVEPGPFKTRQADECPRYGGGAPRLTVTPGRGPVFNDGDLLVAAAVDGLGVRYILEDLMAAPVADGRLVRLLDDGCPPFAGYHLYYPSRRGTQAFELFKAALRAG